MNLEDFLYPLPEDRIATHPVSPRDHSKLMVVHRQSGQIEHRHFYDLPDYLTAEDLLVLNDTRVIPARLHAENGAVEILLLEETSPRHWLAIGKPAAKLKAGQRLLIQPRTEGRKPAEAEILSTVAGGQRVLRFFDDINLQDYGELPLPPYIQKARKQQHEPLYLPEDQEAYQTVFARESGSVAAPTAGLHFTPELLARFRRRFITLRVGLGTFRPVKVADITQHEMHAEHYTIPPGLAEEAAGCKRVVAVGTTACRVLESVPSLRPGSGETRIFIHPPYKFKRTDALVTNFHLPGSTLLMLVAAFMGHDLQREAYRVAIAEQYRFFSYGDAMLVI
ncbi:MAG: tRNA preQ1(34) S-adenosylmethionine ribosyltransferase-isomerase QueA [Methylacidiphilales bacterium]|nr:tRNA preQ1(34) S-adenosylmethionine ribosyltransferase-isomerase QueA [Candidatus Methylacidiphilales bacterium]